jgi:hypothetical protein
MERSIEKRRMEYLEKMMGKKLGKLASKGCTTNEKFAWQMKD